MIEPHFPHPLKAGDRYARFFREVVTGTAQLIAQWQAIDFAPGVMNTDNMSIWA